jgi:aspartyl protease family protein
MWRHVLLIFAGLALFTGFLFWAFPEFNFKDGSQIQLVSLILISTYLMLALFQGRLNLPDAFRYVMAWICIALILMVVYVYRYELMDIKARLTSGLYPSSGQAVREGEVYFAAANDGHYYVIALVNGVKIRFMVDTGASRTILSLRDAKRLGFKPEDLSFDSQMSTANGTVWAAPVKLDTVIVEGHVLDNVSASVSKDDLDGSLLGMSYLEKLKGYRVEKGGLTLQF